jgi:hypothetical protein
MENFVSDLAQCRKMGVGKWDPGSARTHAHVPTAFKRLIFMIELRVYVSSAILIGGDAD